MKNNNFIKTALILFFTVIAVQIAYPQMGNCDMGPQHKMMMEKLKLTEDQRASIEKLMIDHRKQMVDLKADVEKKKLELEQLKMKNDYSRDEFIGKIEDLNSAKNKIALAIANHKMDVYELLTADQKKIFNEMGNRMMKGNKDRMRMMKHKRMQRDF